MSYTVKFDVPKQIVRVTASGTESMNIAMESMRALHNNPEFRPGYGILCDLRKQTFVPDMVEASGIGTLMAGFFYGHKLAFVISDPSHAMAQEIVIAAARAEGKARIFGNAAGAERWLLGLAELKEQG